MSFVNNTGYVELIKKKKKKRKVISEDPKGHQGLSQRKADYTGKEKLEDYVGWQLAAADHSLSSIYSNGRQKPLSSLSVLCARH